MSASVNDPSPLPAAQPQPAAESAGWRATTWKPWHKKLAVAAIFLLFVAAIAIGLGVGLGVRAATQVATVQATVALPGMTCGALSFDSGGVRFARVAPRAQGLARWPLAALRRSPPVPASLPPSRPRSPRRSCPRCSTPWPPQPCSATRRRSP